MLTTRLPFSPAASLAVLAGTHQGHGVALPDPAAGAAQGGFFLLQLPGFQSLPHGCSLQTLQGGLF